METKFNKKIITLTLPFVTCVSMLFWGRFSFTVTFVYTSSLKLFGLYSNLN